MIPCAAMRSAVVLLLVALTAAACGTRGALYLPPPEDPDGPSPASVQKKR